MSTPARKKRAKSGGARRGRHAAYRSVDRRRAAIIEALLQAMSEKGFAATSLTEIAKRAGMSPSHLLYYYPDKESVLGELAKVINDRTLDYMAGLVNKQPEEQCRELVGFYFDRRNVPSSFLSVLVELMGVATHDAELLGRMREQARKFKAFLKQTFRKSAAMSPDDAATVAAAVWMGLLVNSLFDPSLTMSRGGRLMLGVLGLLGGFEEGQERPS